MTVIVAVAVSVTLTAVMIATVIATAVRTVGTKATAREALRLMTQQHFSGLPVVDDATGALVANISVSDVRALAGHDANDVERVLELPVLEYLRLMQRAVDGSGPTHPVVLREDDTFGTAVTLFAVSGLHHLPVIDSTTHCVTATISLSDVIRTVSIAIL